MLLIFVCNDFIFHVDTWYLHDVIAVTINIVLCI